MILQKVYKEIFIIPVNIYLGCLQGPAVVHSAAADHPHPGNQQQITAAIFSANKIPVF